jgi:hypothetical protein
MRRFKTIILLAAVCVIATVISITLISQYYQSDEAKLGRGEISLDQYCSNLGHAAVNQTRCKEFVKHYGYNPF